MSSIPSRHGLGRFFHRRDASRDANEPAPPVKASHEIQRPDTSSTPEAPRRSFGDLVRSRSRSLSRTKTPHRRIQSDEIPSVPTVPIVPDGMKVPSRPQTRDSRPPSRPSRDARPADQSILTLRATGPSVPPRRSSIKLIDNPMAQSNGSAVPIYTSMMWKDDPYSEQVAERNLAKDKRPVRDVPQDIPAPLRVAGSNSSLSHTPESRRFRYETPGQLNHKPDVSDLRTSVDETRDTGTSPQVRVSTTDTDSGVRTIPQKTLERPLPGVPPRSENRRQNVIDEESARPDSGVDSGFAQQREYLVQDSSNPVDLSRVVDLSNTEQTHQYVKWAPAVTKETRIVNTHEVVQQAITREIHNHHVYHRVLPIVDVEVLPPRHFVVGEDGGYREIPETEVPGGAANSAKLHQLINDAVTKMLPESKERGGPRQFTARKFEGTEGDYKEYVTPEGIKRTEQWWVHPPTLETGGLDSGQTQPFHLGSEDPDLDGFRDGVATSSTPNFSRKQIPTGPESQAIVDPAVEQLHDSLTRTVLPIRMRHGEVSS